MTGAPTIRGESQNSARYMRKLVLITATGAGSGYSPVAPGTVGSAVGLALGGIPAVLLAAFIVESLDLYYVRWLVVIVVIYTSLALLRSAWVERRITNVKKAEA